MTWEQLPAAAAFSAAGVLLARACDEFYDVEDDEHAFPLQKLPRELRLKVYERILADEPPSIGLDGGLNHTFSNDSLKPLFEDALCLLFHHVPLAIDPSYATGSAAYICKFFRYHDKKCGFAQRHRVRLHFPIPKLQTHCPHLRCILRHFRCRSSFASPARTRASWGWIATANGIPPENLEFIPGQEPLIDFERLFALCDVVLLFFWLGVSSMRHFCSRILWPIYNDYLLRWRDRVDDLHAYTQQQKRSHGLLGFAKAYLQCATLVFSAVLLGLMMGMKFCCHIEAQEEEDAFCGAMLVTVGIIGFLVWTPQR